MEVLQAMRHLAGNRARPPQLQAGPPLVDRTRGGLTHHKDEKTPHASHQESQTRAGGMTGPGCNHSHPRETVGDIRTGSQMRLSLPPSARLTVMNGTTRRSANHHARFIGTPAKIHAVTEKGKRRVETTQAPPHVHPNEHASRRAT